VTNKHIKTSNNNTAKAQNKIDEVHALIKKWGYCFFFLFIIDKNTCDIKLNAKRTNTNVFIEFFY
jgi:hypothetical protein